jgi:hypothetical protein
MSVPLFIVSLEGQMTAQEDAMIIDCTRCESRGLACASCALTALDEPYADLGPAELRALAALATAGLIPPLRYKPTMARAS